jgi:hypothetical protein
MEKEDWEMVNPLGLIGCNFVPQCPFSSAQGVLFGYESILQNKANFRKADEST